VNGLTILALIACAIGIVIAYRAGTLAGRRTARDAPATSVTVAERAPKVAVREAADATTARSANPMPAPIAQGVASAALAQLAQLTAFAEDRHRLFGALADARAETARYRQIVVDIERNAPPPLLDAPGTPDDLKLIVGVGPVIERMLYQMGIATYRQIARWSERDIDEVDARLPEFPGRIRRDGWVTQARALHVGKYGTSP